VALSATAAVAVAVAALAGVGGDGSDTPARGATVDATPVVTMGGTAASLQQQFVAVVKTVSPAIVQVETGTGLGSGVVFDGQGDIVTNAHVVRGATRLVVTLGGGRRASARLIGADTRHDLAVVRLVGLAPTSASFAQSSQLEVGDVVLAIGNPLGLRSSVTQGIISSVNRTVSEGGGVTLAPVIQTSAAINPGNSGGALVDLQARVVGIPTLTALDPGLGGAQAPGIGFAIPSDTVRQVVSRLLARESPTGAVRSRAAVAPAHP
jgi:S1-C subfamily serine protease